MALPISDDALAAQPSIPLEPLGGVLETIDQGIVLLASDSFPCYTNAAAERLLVADSERGVLTREMRTVPGRKTLLVGALFSLSNILQNLGNAGNAVS